MDFGILIVAVIIILICIIPFALLSINRRGKKRKLLHELTEFAHLNNYNLTEYELWNNSAIGFDDATGIIFYCSILKDAKIFERVNLADVQTCKLVDSNRLVSNKDGNFKVTEKLKLLFTFSDKNKKEVALIFYNAENDSSTLMGELQLAEKWNKIVNDKISEMAKQKK